MSSSFVILQTLLRSSVYGISQTKLLEWVATSFSRGSAQPRDGTCVSALAGGWVLYRWATRAVLMVATPVCIPPAVYVAAVVQSLSHVWLCDPIHGLQTRQASLYHLPFLYHLSELVQTHVRWVSDAIQQSHPLLPTSPVLNLSQRRVFSNSVWGFHFIHILAISCYFLPFFIIAILTRMSWSLTVVLMRTTLVISGVGYLLTRLMAIYISSLETVYLGPPPIFNLVVF